MARMRTVCLFVRHLNKLETRLERLIWVLFRLGETELLNALANFRALVDIAYSAYEPRGALSPMHCAPQDSVRVFKDIRAKKAIGMHWGYLYKSFFFHVKRSLR